MDKDNRGYAGYKCNFGGAKEVIMEAFWTWDKQGGLESDGDPIRGVDRCTDFDKGLWLEYGKHMWRKHQ